MNDDSMIASMSSRVTMLTADPQPSVVGENDASLTNEKSPSTE